MARFEVHTHSMYSNFRLKDCINKPEDLVKRAKELGLSGIALTDHETLAGAVDWLGLAKDNPEIKLAIGNEIYLTNDREPGQKYYHCILIAKDEIGFKQLRKLSSQSWMLSYHDRGMERVPTLKDELAAEIKENPGHIIATTACLGGELSTEVLELETARRTFRTQDADIAKNKIIEFVLLMKELFGDDFYFEVAPGQSKEQIIVNKKIAELSQVFGVKMVIGCDSHFLSINDRTVHKAFLTSQEGEREVDSFYEFSYLQSEEEIKNNLAPSIAELYDIMCSNSMEICEKITSFSLTKPQQIPHVPIKHYDKREVKIPYPILQSMFSSDDIVERYWVNQCIDALCAKFKVLSIGQIPPVYLAELEEEADVKRIVGAKLGTNMFRYPILLQHYMNLIWENGSTVGVGRGSACSALNHYLLGITQLDPIEWKFPFFRYMNRDTDGLGDIDIDICPSKRPLIIQKIKEQRSAMFNENVDGLSKENLGCTLIATYGTETAKSAVLDACRGYRSEDCPDGVDNDTAQYISSLIPSERGKLWSLKETYYGNKEKDRQPVVQFIREVDQYPGLFDVMLGIEGIIKQRGSHASGVIMFDSDPYEWGCFMKTPSGEIITQYDLHMCESVGGTKIDLLVTEVQDKITEAIRLLQEDGEIEKTLTLKEAYNKYLHPDVLPINNSPATWDAIQRASVIDLFQLDSQVGRQGAKKVKPCNMLELSATNGVIRLMTQEKGAETPLEKYVRFKNNPIEWTKEMNRYNLTAAEQEAVKPYLSETYGIGISQEQLMRILMEPKVCNFTLKEANSARKVVSKKKMDQIDKLRKMVDEKALSPALASYVWDAVVATQLGYAFSDIHSISYSFVGYQTAYLSTRWNSIYWNTACLIVNSGSMELNEGEKEKNSDYSKLAKALGSIVADNIKISLIDINKSASSFKPDIENNTIMFGLKALSGINNETIDKIIAGRPYKNIADFMVRCPLNKTQMISLIKAGAFDKVDMSWGKGLASDIRYVTMAYYISIASDPKKKLTLQNFNTLIQKNLLPDSLSFEKRTFEFNKYLKANTKVGLYYVFDEPCIKFYEEHFDSNLLEIINGLVCIKQTVWDKIYKNTMDLARAYLKEHQDEALNALNEQLFMETWEKYAKSSLSAWEMESLCYYYHEHELANIDKRKYGISDFHSLNPDSDIEKYFKRNNKDIPIFKTYRIIGTVLNKDDTRSLITLLTTSGVVSVKFTREQYAKYKKQISEKQEDGTKKVVEKGWFKRGSLLMITGYRRDDQFVAKTYANTASHQIYQIELTNNGTDMVLTHERIDTMEDNDE